MKIVTTEQMRQLDRIAIQERGIPGLDLMERAGRAVAARAFEMIRDGSLSKSVALFAGKGNNGGDACVAARYLEEGGIKTTTVILSGRGEISGDARENLQRLDSTGARVVEASTLEELEQLEERISGVDLVIDGILGTGVKGKVSGHPGEAIFFINGLHRRVLSIDVPSGLNATTGEVCGVAVRASSTVTMGLPKIGLVTGDGIEYSGRIKVADIGLPKDAVEAAEAKGELIVEQDLYSLFYPRKRFSHKGDYGKVLIVAGSTGMTGAAAMAAMGALRGGAGLVTVAVPKSVNPILEAKLTEAMTLPVHETGSGTLAERAVEYILGRASRFDVFIIGPGLSRHPETGSAIRALLERIDKPMVLDADGLNALSEDVDILKKISSPVIITPHPGEMSRLAGCGIEEILKGREAAASDFARSFNVTVALKGALTVVASSDGYVTLNASGNPGMASGGTGDVLTGLIGAFLAQGMAPADAGRAGVFVHGAAGDLAAESMGERSLIATDIVEKIPGVLEYILHRRW